MSQIKYCAKCGGQLLPNAKFCASCGASTSLLPTQPAPLKVTKRKPWFSIIAVVMIILAFLGGASIAPERVVTVTNTYVSTSVITRIVTTERTLVTVGVTRLKVKPGEIQTGYALFEIPQDSEAIEARCVDSLYLKTQFIVEFTP